MRDRLRRFRSTAGWRKRRAAWLTAIALSGLLTTLTLFLHPPEEPPLVQAVGPGLSEPACPILLRLDDTARRCSDELFVASSARVSLRLLSPKWQLGCRPIVSDERGRFSPISLHLDGDSALGELGPLEGEDAGVFTLRFISIDERVDSAEACGLWADVVQTFQRRQTPDAGHPDSGGQR